MKNLIKGISKIQENMSCKEKGCDNTAMLGLDHCPTCFRKKWYKKNERRKNIH